MEKIAWSGRIISIQPRIRLLRSFDERSHSYLGYVLRVEGTIADEPGEFIIAIGKAAQAKHRFRADMEASGQAVLVPDPRLETAGFYKASGLKVIKDAGDQSSPDPPFHGVPPDLETFRSRGHRRLDARTYESKCSTCIWGCRMPVEMIIDHWNPSQKRYRFETFCYGPKSCAFYRAGPTRKVPGRKGMSYTEEDWVDDDATSHRGPDD
ncbi:MAG: hypothetical protein V2J25_08975 [Desulfatiglans sp.]|jgi:hypothetical protein|nr:hypothetical protein [Desulfatiglans sp.]